MSRLLVTGGSSPLGDVLVPRLVQEHDVVAIARSDVAAERLHMHGVRVLRYDLHSSAAFPKLEATAMVHAAGIGFASSLSRMFQVLDLEHIVVVSSASATVIGHPRRQDVLAGEQLLQAAAPDVTVLRPTMIYGGGRDRNVRQLWHWLQGVPFVPRVRGGGYLQPVFADDLAEATCEVLRQPRGEVLPVGGPAHVRFDDLLAAIAGATGRRRGGPTVPLEFLAQLIQRTPLPPRAARSKHAAQMLLVDRTVLPPAAVGFSYSATPLEDGVRIAVERYRSD